MRDLRAVVIGLFVVVIAALCLAFWRRPAPEFHHVKAYRVEVLERNGDSTRRASFTIPTNLIARLSKFAPIDEISADLRADWRNGDVTPKEILDAAAESTPGKPGVVKKDDFTIEVTPEGSALELKIQDHWDKTVRIRLPRSIVESFSGQGRISRHDILRSLDDLGPGDVVVVKNRDKEVTITAEAR